MEEPRAAPLTPAQERIAALVREGRTNREAAELLGLSEKTIEWHLSRVYRKRGLRSRTELAVLLAGNPTREEMSRRPSGHRFRPAP